MNYKVYASLKEDINSGWCWISTPHLPPRSLIRIKRVGSNKKTYCEALHIDQNFLEDYNGRPHTKKIKLSNQINMIVINEWYRSRHGNLEPQSEYDLEILRRDTYWARFRACCHHPQIVVRVATWLALLGIRLGLIGLVLGLIPIVRGATNKTASSHQQISRDQRYPAQWWTPVIDPKKPEWEILPQEAGPGEVILSKRNELGLLSNFAPTPFVFHGLRYASLEGFWQMMKYPEGPGDPRAKFPGPVWKYTRAQVAQMVAFEANHAGTLASENMTKMGITWVSFEGKHFEYKPDVPGEHYKLIVAATWEKVKQNPEVKRVLLSTGDLILKPDHHQEPNAPAAWRYFEILTQIRTVLRQHEAASK